MAVKAGQTVGDLLPEVVPGWALDGTGELVEFSVAGRMQDRTESQDVLKLADRARERDGPRLANRFGTQCAPSWYRRLPT